jgi:ribonuclease D
VPNQALIALSLRPPTSPGELSAISGISEGLVDRRGRDIMAAIQRGLAVPDDELPRFPPSRRWERDPEAEARGERLRDARTRAAERLELDPGFLMSRNVLDEIARRSPRDADELASVPDVRRWQVEALGDDLLSALAG